MSVKSYTTGQLFSRALLGGIGGYMAALGFTIGMAGLLIMMGLHRADATLIAAMLAYIVWVLVVLICFSATTLKPVAVWLFSSVGIFAVFGLLARWAGLFD
jgi:hypothetical protein